MKFITSETIAMIITTLRQVGDFAVRQPAPVSYQLKADRTPFSQVEIEMERQIIGFLLGVFPDHQVVSEESGTIGTPGRFQWFLDPIDGTKMFLIGGSTWGISLGLLVDGKPDLGFFYMPRSGDLFWGGPDYGAWFNGVQLDPTCLPDPNDPLVFFGVPTNFHRRFQIGFPRIRILGSIALHLAFVATGASIGALSRRISLWDIAGLLPILETVGVAVEFYSGDLLIPADYANGNQLPEELIIARPSQMEMIRSSVRKIQ